MFNQTAKTKGKTATPLPVPGSKKKAAKSTPAHRRGHVPGPMKVPPPPVESSGSIDQDADDLTGDDSDESGVEDGDVDEQNDNEGGPSISNIEDMPSMADAVNSVRAKRKGKPAKYDSATNTYR